LATDVRDDLVGHVIAGLATGDLQQIVTRFQLV
jgi:hypothetical protein